MHLTQGKNYIWIFWSFFVAMVVLTSGLAAIRASIKPVAPLLPLFMLFMLVSEIRSRVALNSWWVATYAAGRPMYRIVVVWHVLWFVGLTALATVILLVV